MNQSPPVNVTEKNMPLAGFWRRILACILDFILLGLAGLLLGILAGRYLALLGGFGPFVGFMVAVLYWGWFDSENGGGQTLGKKLCRLQVVSGDGQKLPLKDSLFRAALLAAPLSLSELTLPELPLPLQVIFGLSLTALSAALTYLYLFNRQTRQSFHDIAVGAFVVPAAAGGQAITRTIWPKHLVIVSALMGLLVIGGFFVQTRQIDGDTMQQLRQAQLELLHLPTVTNAAVSINHTLKDTVPTPHSLEATVFLNQPAQDRPALERAIARTLLAAYPAAQTLDSLQIKVSYGYNIGIAKQYQTSTSRFSPQQPDLPIEVGE